MKLGSCSRALRLIVFIVLLLSSSAFPPSLSSRHAATEPGIYEREMKDIITGTRQPMSMPGEDPMRSSDEVLGDEAVCDDGDEECIERRFILEAHLDYIYTQHHNP